MKIGDKFEIMYTALRIYLVHLRDTQRTLNQCKISTPIWLELKIKNVKKLLKEF